MTGLSTLLLARAPLRPRRPILPPRLILTRRLRRVPRILAQLPLKPLHPRGQLLDLTIHPQQHLDHGLTPRVIDRLRLTPVHTPKFDKASLCPPDQLNAYLDRAMSRCSWTVGVSCAFVSAGVCRSGGRRDAVWCGGLRPRGGRTSRSGPITASTTAATAGPTGRFTSSDTCSRTAAAISVAWSAPPCGASRCGAYRRPRHGSSRVPGCDASRPDIFPIHVANK